MKSIKNKESWLNERFAKAISLFSFILLIGISISFIFFSKNSSIENSLTDYGQLVGGLIGVLLSFAGIVLIYATFTEQKKSNIAQDKKQKQQTKLFNQQQFETTFFNLLENHFRLIKSFDGQTGSSIYSLNHKHDKSGYVLLNNCFNAFGESLFRAGQYQVSTPYSNYLTINYYPLNESSINEQIVIKSTGHVQMICDYILNSKQIENSKKETYGKILFASLNESEIYFYVTKNYLISANTDFKFSDFNTYFNSLDLLQNASFPLEQSLNFSLTKENGNLSSVTINHNEIIADLQKIEKHKNGLYLTQIRHSVFNLNCSLKLSKITITKPYNKELEIQFEATKYPTGVDLYIPTASLIQNIYTGLFGGNFEELNHVMEQHKILFSYTIIQENKEYDISFGIIAEYNGRKFTLQFE